MEAKTFTGTDACWEVESHAGSPGTQHNRRGSSGARTTGDKKAPQSPSSQRPQGAELTGEDELLLHHVDVPAGPPHGGAQHDLLGVVTAHATHPEPVDGRGVT